MIRIYIIFIPTLILFIGVKFDVIQRELVDFYALFSTLILTFHKVKSIIFIGFLLSITMFQIVTTNILLNVLSLSIYPIITLGMLKTHRVASFHQFLFFISVYIFGWTLFDLITNNIVEGGDRYSGPFTSSLHLSYICVAISIVLAGFNTKRSTLSGVMIILSAAISGSRVALVGSLVPFGMSKLFNTSKYSKIFGILLVIIGMFVISRFITIRGFIYLPEAEQIRFYGWVRFYNYLLEADLAQYFLGNGRASYGAVGFRLFGDKVFITESSFIMLIYCYGILFGLLLSSYFLYKLFTLETFLFVKIMISGFFLITPFIDSVAILCLNAVLLSNVGSHRK